MNSVGEFKLGKTRRRRNNSLLPQTTPARKTRVGMKYTQEVNIFIMRTYYHVASVETERTAFRHKLHQAFVAKYPGTDVSEKHITD